MTLQQRGPYLHIAWTIIEHSRRAIGPRISQSYAQGVGPVERSSVQHHIIRAYSIPALVHRSPTPSRALGMQHPFGLTGSTRGVDQKGGICGSGISVIGDWIARP